MAHAKGEERRAVEYEEGLSKWDFGVGAPAPRLSHFSFADGKAGRFLGLAHKPFNLISPGMVSGVRGSGFGVSGVVSPSDIGLC